MEGLFLADLASAVEIVLPQGQARVSAARAERPATESSSAQAPLDPGRTFHERLERLKSGTATAVQWDVPALVRAGSTLGDALAGHRTLGREDRMVLGTTAFLVLIVAGLSAFFPWVVGYFIALVAGWFGIVLGVRSILQARRARINEDSGEPDLLDPPQDHP